MVELSNGGKAVTVAAEPELQSLPAVDEAGRWIYINSYTTAHSPPRLAALRQEFPGQPHQRDSAKYVIRQGRRPPHEFVVVYIHTVTSTSGLRSHGSRGLILQYCDRNFVCQKDFPPERETQNVIP